MKQLEAKDLRIGNYLQNNKGEIRVVSELNTIENEFNIKAWGIREDRAFGSNEDNLFPIELTEEWLLNFGFISDAYSDTYLKGFGLDGLMTIHCDKTKGCLELWEDRTSVTLKYVHQLQNLYFCLINEELTINN